jgi:hypothetical protein
MRTSCAVSAAVFLMASPGVSSAFICTVSPDKSAVIIKVSNPYPQETSCTVNCHFKIPGGMASVSCTKTVPASAQGWVLPAADQGRNLRQAR